MLSGRECFAEGLRRMGLEPQLLNSTRLSWRYVVPVGKYAGTELSLGLDVPPDFPNTPPTGPHLSPRLLPLNPNASGHPERVAESPNFGVDWEYWSRPYKNWGAAGRTVDAYMAFLRNLFMDQ